MKNLNTCLKSIPVPITKSPTVSKNQFTTRERLLHTTESLFAKRGFGGLTLRDISSKSGTNLASAHYHFGSKEAMVMEMLKLRIRPINQKRLAYLTEAKKKSPHRPLTTFEIMRALILPIGDEIAKSPHTRKSLGQLVARTFTEPENFIQTMHKRFFGEICEVFMKELRKTHPKSTDENLYWNLHLCISSMLGTLAQHRRLKDFSNGKCNEDDTNEMIERLINFVATGFEAGISRN